MDDRVSKLMLNPSVMTTFMQRGWDNVNEMQDWLSKNDHLQFDDLLSAIPQKNGKDDLTNFGAPDIVPEKPPSASDTIQVVGDRLPPVKSTSKRKSSFFPILLVLIILIAIAFLLSSELFGGSGANVAYTGNSVTSSAKRITEGYTLHGNFYLLNGKEVSMEEFADSIISQVPSDKPLYLTVGDEEGTVNSVDKLIKYLKQAIKDGRLRSNGLVIGTYTDVGDADLRWVQLYPEI